MAVALDANGFSGSASVGANPSVALTTASAGCIIYVVVVAEGVSALPVVNSISDTSSLTWHARESANSTNTSFGYVGQVTYWAHSSGVYSGTITVHYATPSGIDDCVLIAGGITGANTSSPFDPDGPQTVTADGAQTVAMSTANANCLILASAGTSTNLYSGTTPGSLASIKEYDDESGTYGAYVQLSGYVASGTLSSQTVGFTSPSWTDVASIFDAIVPAASNFEAPKPYVIKQAVPRASFH